MTEAPPQDATVEMFVGGLVLDPNTQAPVVILKTESGDITMPIWIGIAEATSIASAIKQVPMGRPLTHDLMHSLLNETGARVRRVSITELRDDTYFAELLIGVGERLITLDSRPSDAIALAVRASAPIYVAREVLSKASARFGALPPALITHSKGEEDANNPESGSDSEPRAEATEPVEEEHGDADLSHVDKDRWVDILQSLDPDDFKYKM